MFGGTGLQGGTLVLVSASLHVEVSVKLVRVFLGIVTGFFLARSCWGGG